MIGSAGIEHYATTHRNRECQIANTRRRPQCGRPGQGSNRCFAWVTTAAGLDLCAHIRAKEQYQVAVKDDFSNDVAMTKASSLESMRYSHGSRTATTQIVSAACSLSCIADECGLRLSGQGNQTRRAKQAPCYCARSQPPRKAASTTAESGSSAPAPVCLAAGTRQGGPAAKAGNRRAAAHCRRRVSPPQLTKATKQVMAYAVIQFGSHDAHHEWARLRLRPIVRWQEQCQAVLARSDRSATERDRAEESGQTP